LIKKNVQQAARSSKHRHPGTAAIPWRNGIPGDVNAPIPFHVEPRGDPRAWGEIHVAIIYETLSAALWAVESLSGLLSQLLDSRKLRVTSVSFSKLEVVDYRALATAASARAEVILLATSGESKTLPDFVVSWLEECLTCRESAVATVATLFRCAETPDGAESPRLQCVQRLAQKAGRGFFPLVMGDSTIGLA
jgi:hypothetical protein